MKALVAIILVSLTASSGRATADSGDGDPAQLHYKSGQRLYAAGAYESAVLEFTEAYRLSGNPALLFNIGQAYRLSGKCIRARDYYQRYRTQEARAVERTNVVERIAEMERCIARRSQAGDAAEPAPAASAEKQATEAAETHRPAARAPHHSELAEPGAARASVPARPRRPSISDGRGRRWSGGVVASAGVLVAGTGVLFWLRANDRADQLSTQFAGGGEWTPEAGQLEDSVARDRSLGTICSAAGGLAIVAGTYLLWSGRRQRDRSRHIAITPRLGGAEVAWSWSF